MSVRKRADLFKRGWPIQVAGLLVLVTLAVVMGAGLPHVVADGTVSSNGVPFATASGTLDPAAWTTPLGSLSFHRLSGGRQRLGQLLVLAQPGADRTAADAASATAAVAALVLLHLLARRDHGVRAPPRAR